MAKSDAKIHVVDFRKKRHLDVAKHLLTEACSVIEGVDKRPAGFVVMAWDDTGKASYCVRDGGPVSCAGVAEFAKGVILRNLVVYDNEA